jgi:hypothetical protein
MQQIRRAWHRVVPGLWQSVNTVRGQIIITALLLIIFYLLLEHNAHRSYHIYGISHEHRSHVLSEAATHTSLQLTGTNTR